MRARRTAVRRRSSRSLKLETLERRYCLSATALAAPNIDAVFLAARGELPLSQTFQLESQPQATKTIYLDFNGHSTEGTLWNRKTGRDRLVSSAWSLDSDRTTYTVAERRSIQQIWAAVAEDFAPFDVNVTTRRPDVTDLQRSAANDDRWGIRVVVGPDPGIAPGALGIAYVGSFDWTSDTPAFVFTETPEETAVAISHEVGHTLGLHHDGQGENSYYAGTQDWGPIMGNPLRRTITQWSRGDYAGATNTEDDLAVIAGENGFGFVADDHGNTIATATPLPTHHTTLQIAGVISSASDRDVFRFEAAAGPVRIDVTTLDFGPNLNARLELYDGAGRLVAMANPVWQFGTHLEATLPGSGVYYAVVTGAALPESGQHSDYGSLGHYQIQLQRRQFAAQPAPRIAPVTTAPPAPVTPASKTTAADVNAVTERHEFQSQQARRIRASGPSTVTSGIRVDGLSGALADVEVQVNIRHTWVSDLELYLVAPDGRRIALSRRRGGSGDDVRATFRTGGRALTDSMRSITGEIEPEESLRSLQGMAANGEWKLIVRDRAARDGGRLIGWSLRLQTATRSEALALRAAPARTESPAGTRQGTSQQSSPDTVGDAHSVRSRHDNRLRALAARDALFTSLAGRSARQAVARGYFDSVWSVASMCSSNRGT